MWITPALAQGNSPSQFHRMADYVFDSGYKTGNEAEDYTIYTEAIVQDGAPWMRVHFEDYNLGERSYVSLTSRLDGSHQILNARTMEQWAGSSAYFNGDAVDVVLHVAPEESDVFISIRKLTIGEWAGNVHARTAQSICDSSDDRTPSADPRVARLTFVSTAGSPGAGCTAWLLSSGVVLTAGHCVDFDPDGFGPATPDGTLDIDNNDVIEFNVPNSLSDGTLQFAGANDQYTIKLSSVVSNFDGEGLGFGKDWAVFVTNANPTTNTLPHSAQGDFFRPTQMNPSDGDDIRVTGHGVDSSPDSTRNQIQQTELGDYVTEDSSADGTWHTYHTDTEGGSSGSPVIWEVTPGDSRFAIGIHTNGGCSISAASGNSGTSFEHNPLENDLQDFHGVDSLFVDKTRLPSTGDGSVYAPYETVQEGLDNMVAGGVLVVVAGAYGENVTLDMQMTLIAPAGSVTIGN
jgi:V8-like Glu-specific endopeptidase